MNLKRILCFTALAALGSAAATTASAQSMDTSSAAYNSGWGRIPGEENRAIRLRANRDANGNRTIVDGIIQTGEDQSAYASSETGSYGGGSGAGYGGHTAIGNSLNVNVIGSYNTVIVDSTQINTGDVIAGGKRSDGTAVNHTELNGGVDLND